MTAPHCWECSETITRPPRAVYEATWSTGDTALLCAKHADACMRGGGFARRIGKDLEFEEGVSPEEMRQLRRAAYLANREPVSEYELRMVVREVLPALLLEMLSERLGAGGIPPPLIPEIERAPVREHRRSQGASSERKKRG